MKLSLRNFALMGAVALSAAVYAQDAVVPTVKKVWSYDLKGYNKNEVRFGTGVNGRVYFNDKANGKVMYVDKDGVAKEYASVEGLGVGITADDAGNLLVNTGFPNAASATNWVIIEPDGTQTPIVLSYPEGIAAARVDQAGRIVGNITTEDGGFFFLGADKATKVALFEMSSKEQVTDNLSFYASETINAPVINTSTIVQPTKSWAEMLDAGDDAVKAFALRNRSNKNIYYYNVDDEFVAMPAPAGANTQEGFDVFMLEDVLYQVQPAKVAANYESYFVIADEEGNVLYEDENPVLGDGNQSFGSYAARKVSESKIEVYQYFACGAGVRCAMYEVSVPAKATKGVFAYDLKSELKDGKYTISYMANGEAAAATLVLTNAADESDVIEVPMGAVKLGENTFTYGATELKDGASYNWAVQITGNEVIQTVEPMGSIGGGRGAVVTFTNPEYDSFGRLLIGRTKNSGFDIYDPVGKKIADAIHFQNAPMGGANANTSSPARGVEHGDVALVASWGDTSCGVVAVNAVDFAAEPYSVFEGELNGVGANVLNGVAVGSGTPCVGLMGKGEDTQMFTFDEDILKNNIAGWTLGTAKTVGVAPENIGFGGLLANQNVSMWGCEQGLFVGQNRVDGMQVGIPGFALLAKDGDTWEKVCEASDYGEGFVAPEGWGEKFLESASGGIAINPAGDIFACTTYTGVNFYLISWDDNGKPAFEPYAKVDLYASDGGGCAVGFDYANNFYIDNPTNGLFRVTLAEKEPVVTTPAKKAYTLTKQSGVDNIAVDNMAGEAVYYNLNGVRVNGELTPGLYIKSVNGKATKVVVK